MHVAKVGLDLPGTNSLPTAPIPEDLKARPIHLTDNARTVLHKRYLRRGEDGQPCETEHEMFWRVAYHVALAETEFNGDVIEQARIYYDILTNLLFFPNSPTFTGAGTPLGQLAACFVIKIDDDMGRTESGIFQALRDAALIQQTGGGNGFAFSSLRPKGALVNSSRGEATGPVGFLRVYDQAFGEIAQGGCLTPDTLVFTDRGLLRLDEIVTHKTTGWQPHQLMVATDEGTRLSTQAYNNGVASILRVSTNEGLQLTGTPNHKVKVMTADDPAWRRLDELQPGDSILVKLGQQQGQLQPLSRPIRQHGNQVMPTFPTVLDKEFAFFLGYMAGDGFVASGEQDHRIGVTVAHSSYLMEEMPALFGRIFGDHLTLHRQQKENDASITFSLDNRAVKDFLTINGLVKARSTIAAVPRLIRQSPPEIVGAFLSGLLEADGSLSHGYPQLLSTSETLIREVAVLLIGLGCPVDIRQQPHAEGHYGQAPVWNLRIHSFKGLLAWRERISCDSRSRFMACYEFQPDLSRESSYPLPCPEYWVTPVLDAIRLPQIDRRGTGKNFRSTQPKLQKQLLRYTRGDRQLTLSGYAQLEDQYDEFAHHARPVNDLWFVTVTAVEDAGEALTLDIEVDDNHTYLANGLTTHNSRRGANMAVLKVSHPDIREFITCKTNESHITNFNISVGMTDEFMRAVEANEDFNLINPQNGEVWETIRAHELFDLIIKQAHHNGEPGVLFLDAANRQNPVPHLYELESTNPCGEQFLGPFENCCLGSINLANLVTADGKVDWRRLKKLTEITTRFLDDVVNANNYVPSVPQLAQAAHRVRRIGLGIMGLGDLMYKLGARYGSEEGQEFAGQIMEFVRFHCMRTSILLARDRGAFPAIRGSIYDPDNLKWQPPTPLFPYTRDWDRPALDWSKIVAGIKKHGIRNGATMTVAPTGCLVPGSMVTTDKGVLPIETLGNIHGERWQDIDLTVVSEGMSSRATQFYINGHAHTIRAVTKRGYTLQGTDGHRIRVWEDGEWVWRRMDELKPGMRVPLQATGLIDEPKQVKLDATLVTDFHATPITLPTEMTPDLAYLVGFFMGDGSLKDRSLRFAISDSATQQQLVTLIQKVFGVDPKISSDNRSSVLRSVEIHSRNLVAFWQNNGFAKNLPNQEHSGKGYQPHIPLAVLRTNDAEIYGAFLAGLFDADGTVHHHNLLSWLTTDQRFHDQVKAVLLALGILTTSDLQMTGLGQSRSYRLRTAHTQAAERLVERLPYLCRTIPCTQEIRRSSLGDTIPLTQPEYDGVLALSNAGKEKRRVSGWRQQGLKASRESLSNFVNEHKPVMIETGLQQLVQTIEDDIFYDGIAFVEDGGWQDTYDISVPGPHAYIANGFVSHNTIATVSGCEAYGCEPVFALAYIRHVNDKGRDLQLQYTSPLFENALQNAGLREAEIKAIVEEVNVKGSCQDVDDVPEQVRHTFVVSSDVSTQEHIRMQAAMQRFVDNAISKTINMPADATVKDVEDAYMLGWKLGCKGLTVYVTGSREKVVLETHATAQAKQEKQDMPDNQEKAIAHAPAATVAMTDAREEYVTPLPLFPEFKKPRPRRLEGRTYRVGTPVGRTYVTINANGEGADQPFELFIHTSKAGSELAAISEAIGRLISLVLRVHSPITPRERLKEIVRQLEGIGGGHSTGFGAERVRSLPDGVAQALQEYLDETSELADEEPRARLTAPTGQMQLPTLKAIGDLCPECGEATLINEEGCRKCHTCGYSEC